MHGHISLNGHFPGDRYHDTQMILCKLVVKTADLVVGAAGVPGIKMLYGPGLILRKIIGCTQENLTLGTDQPDLRILIDGQGFQVHGNAVQSRLFLIVFGGSVFCDGGSLPV